MGQRMKPQPIPSLLEYKTIRLRDRYSPPDTDPLERGKATSEQGQTGGLHVDANGKPASATSQQLSPSLASYGGMHSFSQMAQFLPSICNQNIKRRPSSLLPLSMPGLSTRQSSEDTESTIKPFYRSSMPEAFLSASSNLINSSATVPSYVYTGNFFYNQFGAKSSSGLECIGKSDLELKKPTANSEPSCKLKSDTLPPIGHSHCTAHPQSCSCRHRKNGSQDKSDSAEKKSVKKINTEGKRESKAVAGRRKVKRGGTYGMEPKVTKPVRKSEKKVGLKKNQRQNCQPSLEARKSIGSQQKQQVSHHGQQQTTTHEDEEEEGVSSYIQGIHTNTSPPSNMSDRDDETYYDPNKDEEESELDYFHRNSSILHPPPNYLPPVTKSKARIQRTSLLEDLGEQSDNLNNIGWAKDGFLEDSNLKRALLLRSQALYNTSSNNTTVDFDDKPPVCSNVLCENVQQETKDEISEEVKEIRKSLKVSARKSAEDTQEKNVPKREDFEHVEEKKLRQPHHICSVTWQEVLPHLGPKKKRTTKSTQRSSKLNPVVDIKSQSSNASEASRRLQKNSVQKLRDHTKCISTVPETLPEDESTAKLCIHNLPPVQPFTLSDLAICCRARTSKSLGALPLGNESTDLPNLLPDATTPCSSNYNKFVKMFSLPVYKTRFPPNEQTRREKKFEGHIAGKKVKPVGHLETSLCECPKEELVEPEAKPK